jgi:hypothetical protein
MEEKENTYAEADYEPSNEIYLAPDVPPKDGKQIHREASSFHTGKFEQ